MDGDTIAVSCLVGVDVAELLGIKQCMIRSEGAIFHCGLVTDFNGASNVALVSSSTIKLLKHTTSPTKQSRGGPSTPCVSLAAQTVRQQGLCSFRRNSATFVGYVKQNKTGVSQPSLLLTGRRRFQKRPEIHIISCRCHVYVYNIYMYTCVINMFIYMVPV